MKQIAQHCRSLTDSGRRGFTLIEVLIVVSILLILLTITAVAVNFNNDLDRVRQGARQIQSFLMGARDRALQSGAEVAVRFYFDQPADSADELTKQLVGRQVSAMAYLARSGTWPPADGLPDAIERIATNDLNGDGDTNDAGELSIFSSSTAWWSLKLRGWLVDGLRIRIPDSPAGSWYQIDTSLIDISVPPPAETELRLLTPNNGAISVGMSYSIELPWMMLPEEPSVLPENVVIDLDASRVPTAWRPVAAGDLYQSYVDLVFSPRGTVVGDAAGSGLLHFFVCDAEDFRFLKEQYVTNKLGGDFSIFNDNIRNGLTFVPMDEINAAENGWLAEDYVVRPRRLVTVVPQTGAVSVHDVYAYIDPEVDLSSGTYAADPDKDGLADDPYRFAETGEASQ